MSRSLRYNPVLFDLDGTLVDSAQSITESIRYACAEIGSPLDPGVDLTFCVGPPLEESLSVLLDGRDAVHHSIEIYRRHYRATAPSIVRPFAGVDAVLVDLQREEAQLAVVTYKPVELAEALLVGSGLRSYFALVVGRRAGPDPRPKSELIRETLRLLLSTTLPALYIGDHDDDRSAAEEAGVEFARFNPNNWRHLHDSILFWLPL